MRWFFTRFFQYQFGTFVVHLVSCDARKTCRQLLNFHHVVPFDIRHFMQCVKTFRGTGTDTMQITIACHLLRFLIVRWYWMPQCFSFVEFVLTVVSSVRRHPRIDSIGCFGTFVKDGCPVAQVVLIAFGSVFAIGGAVLRTGQIQSNGCGCAAIFALPRRFAHTLIVDAIAMRFVLIAKAFVWTRQLTAICTIPTNFTFACGGQRVAFSMAIAGTVVTWTHRFVGVGIGCRGCCWCFWCCC